MLNKEYQIELLYGLVDQEYTTHCAFEVIDPEAATDLSPAVQDAESKIAEALDVDPNSQDFALSYEHLTLPSSLVERIKADGVQEYRERLGLQAPAAIRPKTTKYILVECGDREISIIGAYDTPQEANERMSKEFSGYLLKKGAEEKDIEEAIAMGDEYQGGEFEFVSGAYAWSNFDDDYLLDWRICKVDT